MTFGEAKHGGAEFCQTGVLSRQKLIYNERSLSNKAMVHLAGAGHEVPAPASEGNNDFAKEKLNET